MEGIAAGQQGNAEEKPSRTAADGDDHTQSAAIRSKISAGPIRLKGMDSSLEESPTWTWREEMKAWVAWIHGLQYEQYDPKHRRFHSYRSSLATIMAPDLIKYFDQEATNGCGTPLDALTEHEIDELDGESVNVHYVKILQSDVGFPVNLFGTVLVRDEIDLKCIYLFRRDRDNCQLIKSPGETLNLIGPYRGPRADCSIDFEVNLKIRGDKGESTDRIFCKDSTEVDSYSGETKCYFSSWLSTFELAYTIVHFAVQVAIGINILKGPSNFLGIISARSTAEPGDVVLYDSESHGTQITVGDDGYIALSRNIVVLRVHAMLLLTILVYDDDMRSQPTPTILTLGHSDKSVDIGQGSYELRVKLDWSSISRQMKIE